MAIDVPNGRSLHSLPTPRLGGVAIISGASVSAFIYYMNYEAFLYIEILIGLGMVAVISLMDDYVSINSAVRFMIHFLAALLVVDSVGAIEIFAFSGNDILASKIIAAPLTILFIVWMTNLYNFMDGIDGLAGGMALFGFGALGVIGFYEGQTAFAVINLAIASSSLGFLVWNYPPAKIFMGDSGSSSLGFLAAVLSIWAHMNEIIPIWISVVIFSPFIVDASVTLIIRIIKRERFWAAHKTHHYQLLADSGMDRRKLVNYEYVLMLVCAVIAVISYDARPDMQALFILMLGILYIVLMLYVRKQAVKSAGLKKI